nr:NADH dehydrogenase subunit 1 [Aphidius gifuensis]WLE65365.1 NADH dehydrogenase subunit 1 [Aphidius gifuensis]WLE65378.1 NADH dehydrogenase subunit 1 [Aphidius gifuensis]WLE65391.1 NADH dehydrogenase subunit 1 [Aphidius gifuensis]WLE65404.1 NADH dehydrogenase subunit 1 [Aphidius gifuensis]
MMQIMIYMLNIMIMFFLVLINILISVAFLTLFERKILAYFHYRKGPNKVSFMGLMQPFSDALKLLSKEFFYPMKSNFYFYLFAPMLMFILILSLWIIYPFMTNSINMKFNLMFFLSLLSMGVYGLMMSGWSSNNSFSMIGSLRSIAQSISYEVTLSISLLLILMMINNINLNYLYNYQKYLYIFILFMPLMIMMFISMLAEINRTPFDLSEGESELVSGFNIEYSNSKFILIFLAEYTSIIFMMLIFVMVFFNNNFMNILMYLVTIMLIFLIVWIRITLPRTRYDNLMYFCWYYKLPLILMMFMAYLIMLKYPLEMFFLMNYK